MPADRKPANRKPAKPRAKRAPRAHSHPKNSKAAEAFHRRHRMYPIAEKTALGKRLLGTTALVGVPIVKGN